jgi:hypothetical protein
MYSLAEISNSADADYFAVNNVGAEDELTKFLKETGLGGGSKLEIQKDLPNDQAIAPPRSLPAATVLKPFSTEASLRNAIVVPMKNIKKANKCQKARAQKISMLLTVMLVLMMLLGLTVKYKVV